MKDEKYLVFKRDEFIERHGTGKLVEALDDAVVIRKQDIFAGPALHAYASSIQTAIEVVETSGAEFNRRARAKLYEVRDYFFQQALEADDVNPKKVPD